MVWGHVSPRMTLAAGEAVSRMEVRSVADGCWGLRGGLGTLQSWPGAGAPGGAPLPDVAAPCGLECPPTQRGGLDAVGAG